MYHIAIGTSRNKMSTYTTAKNVALFFIASLVVVSFNYNNNNHFSSFDIVPYHQTSLAIPNLQTNNNISTSGPNDTSINFVPTINHSPVANAGADQTVNAGDTLTLDGSKSTDPDGNIVSYLWKQIEGPTVDLYNNTNSTANFLSPTVSADTPLKFSLTVKDSKDIPSIPAIVTITVKAVPLLTTNMTAKGNITTTDNVSSLTGKGDALYYQEKYDQAIQYYDKALAIDPNDTYALSSKGYALDGLGKYEEAIEYYDKALAIDPNDANALNGKGYALGNLGNYTEAVEYLDKALAIDPNDANALNGKGLSLDGLGNYTESIQYYDKALAIDPNDANALNGKNLTLKKLGNGT
jgi:tetratricopeptide (TPR) repeat protein